MLNRCRNCGGEMQYEIETGQLRCTSCDSTFDPDDYRGNAEAEMTEAPGEGGDGEMDVTVYTCPNCGGQIVATENAAVDYCLYCGSFVELKKEMSRISMPDDIIPFEQTKEACKKAYRRMIGSRFYAAKEFRDESFLKGFKGIYIPYWSYDHSYGPKINIPGEKSTRRGDYIYKQHFDIICDVDNAKKSVAFDASSSLDDEISRNLMPVDVTKRKPFNPAYMFGFFADTADVPSSLYTEDARVQARDEIWEEIASRPELRSGNPDRPSDEVLDDRIRLKSDVHLTMLPVWFLTWKKGDRVAYSVVNGQSGRINAEIPVSIGRYFLGTAIWAVPIFIMLNMLFTFNAATMLGISMVLSLIMFFLYAIQLEAIVKKQLHADDKGYQAVHMDGKAPEVTENLVVDLFKLLFSDFHILFAAGAFLFVGGAGLVFGLGLLALALLVLVVPFYSLWVIYRQGKQIGDKTVVLDVLGAVAAFFAGGVLLIMDPAADLFYYTAGIVCLCFVGITAIRTMQRYNDLVTRPLPHYFDRKAGK